MRKIILTTIITLPLFAQSSNFFEIGAGSQKITDNFHVESTQNNSSYNESDSSTQSIPYIQFHYRYKNIITKTMKDNVLLGYTIENITAGVFTSISNSKDTAWSNPFTLNASKEKTKVTKNGLYGEYSIGKNKNYDSKISYTYTKYDIENDTSIDSLQRDANDHKLRIDNRYKSNIIYNISYNIHDAKGEASSFKSYDAGVGYIYKISKSVDLVLLGNIGKISYNETNTVLNEKIDVTTTQFTAVSTWKNPFGLNDKYIKLTYRNENEDANHDFYDKQQQLAIVSMGFKF